MTNRLYTVKRIKIKRRSEADRLAKTAMAKHDALAHRVHERFCQILDQRFGLQAWYLKEDDQARLLNLWRIIEKTGLSFEEGVEAVLNFWLEKQKGRSRGVRTLPVRVWNLTGKVSQSVLESYIQKNYPTNEHLKIWKQEMRQAYLSRMIKTDDASVPFDQQAKKFSYRNSRQLTNSYQQSIEEVNQQRKVLERKLVLSKRAWRGNPFTEE